MTNHLYVAFDLPAPRAQSFLSVRRPGSLTFPDFTVDVDPVEAARDFMDRLFFLRLSDRTIIQMKFTMAFICVLEVVVTAILVGRLYDRSFWIFRFARKANGTLIVPNALIDFSLFAGIFGYFLIAINFLMIDWFHQKKHKPTWWPLLLCTAWIFVAIAAHLAGMGTHFARPQSTSDAKAPGRFGRTIGRPLFVNIFTIFSPLVWGLAIVSVGAVANNKWRPVLDDFLAWQENYANAPALTRDMLVEATRLWERLVDVYVVLGIAWLIWTVWAFEIFVQYSVAAARLLYVIGRQIKRFRKQEATAKSRQTMRLKDKAEAGPLRLKKLKSSPSVPEVPSEGKPAVESTFPATSRRASTIQGKAERGSWYEGRVEGGVGELQALPQLPSQGNASSGRSTCYDKDEGSSNGHAVPPTPGSSKSLLRVPSNEHEKPAESAAKAPNRPVFADDSADEYSDDDSDEGDDDDEGLDENEQRQRQLFTNAEIEADDPTATFFPPVKPSRIIAHKQLVQKQPRAKSFSNKSSHLVSIYRHVLLQFVAIGPAVIILVGWTTWNAIGLPSCAERNSLPEVVGHGMLWVDYTCCVAGCMTLVGIAQRTYEPIWNMNLASTVGSSEGGSKKRRRRKSRATAAGNGSTAQNVTTWFESQTLSPAGAHSMPSTAPGTSMGMSSAAASSSGGGKHPLSTAGHLPPIRQSEDEKGIDPTTSGASIQALRPISLGTVENLPATITRPRGKRSTSQPNVTEEVAGTTRVMAPTPRLGSNPGIFADTMSTKPVGVGVTTAGFYMQRTVETAYEVPDPHLTNPLPGNIPMPASMLEAAKPRPSHERVWSEDSLAGNRQHDFFASTTKKTLTGPLAGKTVAQTLSPSASMKGRPAVEVARGSGKAQEEEEDSDDDQDDYGEPEHPPTAKPSNGAFGSGTGYAC